MKYIGSVLGPACRSVQRLDFPSFPESGGVSPLPEVGHCDRSLNYSAVAHALKPVLVLRWSDVRRTECLRLLCGTSRAAPLTCDVTGPDDDLDDDDRFDDDDLQDDLDDDDDDGLDLDDDELYDALSALRATPTLADRGAPGVSGSPSPFGFGAFAQPRDSNTGVTSTNVSKPEGNHSDSVRKTVW